MTKTETKTETENQKRMWPRGQTTKTVSGQNKIGRELTLLAFIQPTVIKQQAVNNNQL